MIPSNQILAEFSLSSIAPNDVSLGAARQYPAIDKGATRHLYPTADTAPSLQHKAVNSQRGRQDVEQH